MLPCGIVSDVSRPATVRHSPSSQSTRSPLSMRSEQKGTESEPPPAPEEGDSPRRDWQVPQAVSTSQQRHAFVITKLICKTSACKILRPFDGPKSVHICPKFLMQSSLLRPFASSSASRSPMSMRSPVQQKVSETEPPPAPEEGALDKDRVSSPMWAA